jgi:DNA polymerase III subunit delta
VADELRPLYLLGGTDRPKIGRALARLRARFGDEAVELLSAETTSGEDAAAACNALGLFGGGRLVVVEDVERWKKADVEAIQRYAEDPVAGAVLALVAGEPLKDGALAAIAGKAGSVLLYEVPKPRDPSGWVRSEFERLGVEADAEAARRLVEIVGEDIAFLEAEVEKLASWAGGEPVTVGAVEQLAAPAQETTAWALTDAWGARDLPNALAACEADLEGDGDPFVIAMRLAGQVDLVRSAQALSATGLGAREIAKRVRRHEFRVRKALAHAENYSRDELDGAVVRLAELDAALKGASRLAGELELERALVDVTARREPARAEAGGGES